MTEQIFGAVCLVIGLVVGGLAPPLVVRIFDLASDRKRRKFEAEQECWRKRRAESWAPYMPSRQDRGAVLAAAVTEAEDQIRERAAAFRHHWDGEAE